MFLINRRVFRRFDWISFALIVLLASMGLLFIGLRLDPRLALPLVPKPPTMPKHEPDPLGDAFRKKDHDQEEIRSLTEQIRKAIEGSEGDASDEG